MEVRRRGGEGRIRRLQCGMEEERIKGRITKWVDIGREEQRGLEVQERVNTANQSTHSSADFLQYTNRLS